MEKNIKKVKLANFDNPKWSYEDLKGYAKKYRTVLETRVEVPEEITTALYKYQMQTRDYLISNLKKVQKFLYK